MTREHDWKIHELMGNDLTGWEWLWKEGIGGTHVPFYSTTWEGAGLVMDWLTTNGVDYAIRTSIMTDELYEVIIHKKNTIVTHDDSGPLALAKAVIAAMEERENA